MVSIPVSDQDEISCTLEGLSNTIPVDLASRVEVVVSCDARGRKAETVRKQLARFSKLSGIKSTFWPSQTRGKVLNHNRILYCFTHKSEASDLVVLNPPIVPRGDFWRAFREVFHETSVGLIGIKQEGKWNPGAVWMTRETALSTGYLDVEVESCTEAWALYRDRVSRQLGVGLESLGGVKGDLWGDVPEHEAASHLLSSVRNQYLQAKTQYRGQHGIPNPEKEWDSRNTILASRAIMQSREIYRAPIQSSPKLDYREPSLTTTYFSGTVVVLAIRGAHREKALLKVIHSLQRQTVPVKIVLVELDTEPRMKSRLLPYLDRYVFCWSNRPFNKSWAFNVGVMQYDSPFVLLHDADIVVPPEYIEKSLERLGEYDAMLPWRSIAYLDPDSSSRWPEGDPNILYRHDARTVHGGSVLVKRDFYLAIRGMDERFESWGGEDDCLYYKLTHLGRVIPYNAEKGFDLHHLHHPPQDDPKRTNIATANNYRLLSEYWKAGSARMLELSSKNFGNPNKTK